MIQTAENVSKEYGVTREACDAVTLRRQEQYQDALANDREFQKRYMFPVEVQISRKKTLTFEADEGISPSTKEGLASLKPVIPEGVHTFGTQTHPADGNCGISVTTATRPGNSRFLPSKSGSSPSDSPARRRASWRPP
jgi:acetyl-CoA acetyltransferase